MRAERRNLHPGSPASQAAKYESRAIRLGGNKTIQPKPRKGPKWVHSTQTIGAEEKPQAAGQARSRPTQAQIEKGVQAIAVVANHHANWDDLARPSRFVELIAKQPPQPVRGTRISIAERNSHSIPRIPTTGRSEKVRRPNRSGAGERSFGPRHAAQSTRPLFHCQLRMVGDGTERRRGEAQDARRRRPTTARGSLAAGIAITAVRSPARETSSNTTAAVTESDPA